MIQEIRKLGLEIKTQAVAMKFIMTLHYFPWDKISHNESAVAASQMTPSVLIFYKLKGNCCQLLGKTNGPVKNAHIWPNHTHGNGLQLFNLSPENVSDPRNFLRLHGDIEYYFDRCHLTFVPSFNGSFSSFKIHVLDPGILNVQIGGSSGLTFSELHGRSLIFHNKNRPYARILAAHAYGSFQQAASKNWINDTELSHGEMLAKELARHSLDAEATERMCIWLKSFSASGSQVAPAASAAEESKSHLSSSAIVPFASPSSLASSMSVQENHVRPVAASVHIVHQNKKSKKKFYVRK